MTKPKKVKVPAVAVDFTHDALFLRTTDALGRAHQGYQYDLSAEIGTVMVCPDWNPKAVCGGGFHGLLDGLGSMSYLKAPSERDAIWWVFGVLKTEAVEISGDKHKVPRMKLLYKGSFGGAMAQVSLPLAEAIIAKVGDRYSGCTLEGEAATGARGAASATGESGAASATGWSGAASATGWSGAASATGARGAASATGESGAASATGAKSVAMACGHEGRALAAEGCAIFLAERDRNGTIIAVAALIVGKDGIKADTWYTLRGGKPVEVGA